MAFNKANLHKLHRSTAPIMVLPVMLTLITGSVYQLADLSGNADTFEWLLDLHKGKFGTLNLAVIYPFFNALGLLTLALTGVMMWLKIPRRHLENR